jgi:type IV pilus assembly protein PilC
MARFAWEGKNRGGQKVTGEVEAPNEAFVLAQLRRDQISPVSVKKKGMSISLKIGGEKKVTQKELAVFTRQFATMIDAGLPLVQCLDILGAQQENASFKKVLVKVKEDVESGSSLSSVVRGLVRERMQRAAAEAASIAMYLNLI